MNNDLPRIHDARQPSLFPQSVYDACKQVGINLWTACQFYKAGLISFDPEIESDLTDAQFAELSFVDALVAANCSPSILNELLCKLEKPYNYSHSQIYYDWEKHFWRTLPHEFDVDKYVAKIADDGDSDALNHLELSVNGVRDYLGIENDDADEKTDSYEIEPDRNPILISAKQLLWKIASSSLITSPSKAVSVGKMFSILQRLPNVTKEDSVRVELTGPTRMFGSHEITHWWAVELQDDGELRISSGGAFYRPETGGDGFSSMLWSVMPGREPAFNNYLQNLSIVDDADTFENEVQAVDLDAEEYKLSVTDESLEDWMDEEDEDTDDS